MLEYLASDAVAEPTTIVTLSDPLDLSRYSTSGGTVYENVVGVRNFTTTSNR